MRIYQTNIAQGIGDNIQARSFIDQVKDQYDRIFITHHAPIVQKEKNNSPEYWKFLHEIGELFFSEPPYIYNQGQYPFRDAGHLLRDFRVEPQKPQLKSYLCKGSALNLDQEYIVITTKIRYMERSLFNNISSQLMEIIRQLSLKYKIVILGEKEVEMCPDYLSYGINKIYSIYNDIKSNITNNILDLTIPVLGITSPTISQIQQDCLIMNQAKFVITLGDGGNLYMAAATSNVIGFRSDNDPITDKIFSKTYSDALVVKNFNDFADKLRSYI
jgi:hypothetical protein